MTAKRPGSRLGLIHDNGVDRPYDPDLDYDVPAMWLGPSPADPDESDVQPLDPEHDLREALR